GVADDECREAIARVENGNRQLRRDRRGNRRRLGLAFRGVRHEVKIQPVRRDIRQDRAKLRTVAVADRVDESLRRDADINSVTFLSEKTGWSEPGYILGPINVLLQPIEDLLPYIHRDGSTYLYENPQLFHTCGNSLLVEKGRRY